MESVMCLCLGVDPWVAGVKAGPGAAWQGGVVAVPCIQVGRDVTAPWVGVFTPFQKPAQEAACSNDAGTLITRCKLPSNLKS